MLFPLFIRCHFLKFERTSQAVASQTQCLRQRLSQQDTQLKNPGKEDKPQILRRRLPALTGEEIFGSESIKEYKKNASLSVPDAMCVSVRYIGIGSVKAPIAAELTHKAELTHTPRVLSFLQWPISPPPNLSQVRKTNCCYYAVRDTGNIFVRNLSISIG